MQLTKSYFINILAFFCLLCYFLLCPFLYAESMMTINFSNDSKATNTQQNNSLESFYGVSSDKMKMQQNFATKEEYLAKFYAVWDFSQINTDKNAIFYIIPSLQNAISYNKELQELKRNPPKKNNKNYKKAEQIYLNKIANLEKKIESLLGVGENLLPNKLEEFSTLLENMNLGAFLQNPQPAIIVRATAVRAVPTHKPRYKNKGDFPFDRWQNSFIFEGTPAMITHFSTDGRYAHIQSPFVYGWVDTRSIALVDNSMRNKILRIDDYKIPNKDFIPIRHENQWILDARIGQIFPYDKRKNKLLTFYKDTDNYAQIREVNFDLYLFSDFPIPFSAQKMSHLIDMMLGQKYGWGGIFGNRDCSAFTRDSFAGFGVFLPRNSAAQAQYGGNFVDLSKMSEHDKEAYIIANGIPFGSIIWLKGHIMLYIGHTNIGGINRAIVAHSAWGVNPVINNKKEKILLGGVKITTLHVGGSFTSNTEVKNSLLSRIRGITNIYTESNGQYDISQLQISY